MDRIKLGDRVWDKISGFERIVIGITHWLYGCVRCGMAPEKLHEGKLIDNQWFDEPQLDLVSVNPNQEITPTDQPGGPRNNPQRNFDPVR